MEFPSGHQLSAVRTTNINFQVDLDGRREMLSTQVSHRCHLDFFDALYLHLTVKTRRLVVYHVYFHATVGTWVEFVVVATTLSSTVLGEAGTMKEILRMKVQRLNFRYGPGSGRRLSTMFYFSIRLLLRCHTDRLVRLIARNCPSYH